MAVNYGLLEPVNIAGNMMAGRQQAQQNQLAQQQAEMRQQEFGMRQQEFAAQAEDRQLRLATQAEDRKLKLDRAAERDQFLTTLSDQMKQGGYALNRETLSSMMNFGLKSNEESLVNLATKGLQALDEQDQFKSEMGRVAPKPNAPMGALGSGTFDVNAPTNALAPTPSTNAMVGGYSRSQVEQMLSSPNARIRDMGKSLLGALPKETAPTAPPVSIAEFNLAQKDPEFMRFLQARSAANRAPAPPRPEQPPVAVVDPATGKQVYVTREQALSGRMTPAAAMESLPAKEIQKREAALPQATSSIKGFESKADKFIGDLIALRDDPGLENITGPIFGRTGSVTREGSRAQAIYDKIVAKGGFQALQDLRDASKTGGALGNVSNQEGKQLTASFAAIDRRQNAADVRAAIDQAISDIEGSKTRMREAYDSTYSYKSGGTPAPAARKPAAGNAVDTSNPLLK